MYIYNLIRKSKKILKGLLKTKENLNEIHFVLSETITFFLIRSNLLSITFLTF